MSPIAVISLILAYFLLLISISYFSSRHADITSFYNANKNAPWYLVAFGMIGATLSGITFISIPGVVGGEGFAYFQVVLGYILGYLVIGKVLLPLYYQKNLITIYTYLDERFGNQAYRTGSFFFLLSRTIGASFRLYLVATVLQLALFDAMDVPFWLTILITIVLIWVYTYRSGIKTIVITDAIQTLCMLAAVVVSIFIISRALGINGIVDIAKTVHHSDYANIFVWDWQANNNFFKQFFSGAFIAIVMTGLDQDMMQKNLTCRNLGEAQKNMFWFSLVLIFANLLFLSLGALLYMYTDHFNLAIPEKRDMLYPMLSLEHFGIFGATVFLLGIIAAAYSSADSALTSLTTAFCLDFLRIDPSDESKRFTRTTVHVGFSFIMFWVVFVFNTLNNDSVINSLFKAAGYTYGPLLGLFFTGLFTKWQLKDKLIPVICVITPIITFIINENAPRWFNGYEFGFEILILNGLLTFIGFAFIRKTKGVKSWTD